MRTLPFSLLCAVLTACPDQRAESTPDAGQAPAPPVELTLLLTGSENGYLLPSSADDGSLRGGAAQMLGHWVTKEGHCAGPLGKGGESACKEGSTVVLSAGDNANGAAISSVFHGEPAAELMKHMGYAASVFGNHEVDFGRPQFARNRETGAFPYLAANLPASADADSAAPLGLSGSVRVQRQGLELLVVGLSSEKTRSTPMPGRLDDVTFIDDVQAMASVPGLSKAAAVVVLTDGCLAALAAELEAHPEWKVAVAAGQQCHDAFPPKAGGATLVAVGRHFQAYGRVKLTFRGGKLAGVQAETVDLASTEAAEPKAQELIAGWKQKLDALLGEAIGYSQKGVAQEQLGSWLATALKEQYHADIGLVNAKGARASLPKGQVTKASVFDLIPFENSVVVVKVPGEQLKQALSNPEARFVGLKSAKQIDAKKTYTVATNSYVFFGGDGFSLQKADPKPTFTGEPWQDAVIAWTQKKASSEKKPLETFFKP
jgi:2',3'-cyclic-nucleotide 2'-phosphodiesterase (5'-nucleotidase family)